MPAPKRTTPRSTMRARIVALKASIVLGTFGRTYSRSNRSNRKADSSQIRSNVIPSVKDIYPKPARTTQTIASRIKTWMSPLR